MWTGRHTAILGAASAVSLGVGSVSGYFLAKRKLGRQFDERLEQELQQMKAFYQTINKPSPEFLAEQLLDEEDLQPKHQYDTTSDEVPQEVLERIADNMAAAQAQVDAEAKPITEHNAFEDPAPAWVQADEELERRNGVPYIISHDEFYNNEWEFEEGQLTYYEGDDTLTDSRDEPIPQQYATVGELTLEKFGHGSNDPNIVYVCNEKMEMIFEICRSNKSYAVDVLGYEDKETELKHSDRPLKFKDSRARG